MPLTTSNELLTDAQRRGFAIPAFNVENMEMVLAVVQAADEMKSPVIIQTTPSTINYASAEVYAAMVSVVAQKASIPVVMHLDHGNDYELCRRALKAGYTSLMIDGSKLDYEKNIKMTKEVVEMASSHNIPVEAELGTVGGKEDSHEVKDKDAQYTNPAQAEEFVSRTKISSLAVAIGTAHGFYQGVPKLDIERLKEIRSRVDVPLVLHGASGVPDETVSESIRCGICKVNYATELRVAFTKGLRPVVADEAVYDPKKYGKGGWLAVSELVRRKIRICGSADKA